MFLHRKGVSCKGATKINRRYAGLFFCPKFAFLPFGDKKNNSHKQIKLDIDLSDDVREVFEIDLEKFFRRATLKHNILIPPGGQKLGVKSRF